MNQPKLLFLPARHSANPFQIISQTASSKINVKVVCEITY